MLPRRCCSQGPHPCDISTSSSLGACLAVSDIALVIAGLVSKLLMATASELCAVDLEYAIQRDTAVVDSYLASLGGADAPSGQAAAPASTVGVTPSHDGEAASHIPASTLVELKRLWLSDLALVAAPQADAAAADDAAPSGSAMDPSSSAAQLLESDVSGDGWPKLVDSALVRQLLTMQKCVRFPRQEEVRATLQHTQSTGACCFVDLAASCASALIQTMHSGCCYQARPSCPC